MKQIFSLAALACTAFLPACHKDAPQEKVQLKCDLKTLAGCSDEQKASINMSGDSLNSSHIHIGDSKKPPASADGN